MDSRFPSRFFPPPFLVSRIAIAAILAVAGLSSPATAASKSLVVAEKHRVAAGKDTHLILVLDLKPNLDELRAAGAEAPDLIRATAASYAKEYLARAEFSSNSKVVVYPISVESMDEYNRAKFDGMKRYGTIAFEKKGDQIVLTEDKLAFAP